MTLVLAACAAERPGHIVVNKNSNQNKKIVVHDSREYRLSRDPDYAVERDFQALVSEAFSRAFIDETFDARKSFSYTINPKGAVYPFSKANVNCLVREDLRGKYANEICGRFYEYIDRGYSRMKEELQ